MSTKDTLPTLDGEQCDFLTIDLYKMKDPCACVVVKLKGQIDTYSAGFFQKNVERVMAAGYFRLIFELGDVDYLSSKAVGAFVQIRRAATRSSGRIAIVSVHPKVRNVFKNLKLEKFLCCTNSLDEAVALVSSDGDGEGTLDA